MAEFNESPSRRSHSRHTDTSCRTTSKLLEHVHSTPTHHSTHSLRTSNSEPPVRRHARSPPAERVRQNLNNALNGCEAGSNSSVGSSLISITSSPSRQAQVAEFENATIQKQRQELHLLVAELRDRDRELNEMVSSHQKQLLSWEQDRQKNVSLERSCSQLEQAVHERNNELRALTAKLNIAESCIQNQLTALDSTQRQLASVTDQHSHVEAYAKELEEKNRSANQSLVRQASSVGQLEAHEHELETVLKLKDRDLVEAANQITELCRKLKKFGGQYRESRTKETETKRRLIDCRNKCSDSQHQLTMLQREQLKRERELDESKLEAQRLCQETATLKQEILLFDEREKRRDQLGELQKSKQDRLESELSALQQLYERQQRDMCLLHLNLESTKRLLTHRDMLQLNRDTRRNSVPTDSEPSKDRKKQDSVWEEERKQEGLLAGKGNDKVEEGCNSRLGETVMPPGDAPSHKNTTDFSPSQQKISPSGAGTAQSHITVRKEENEGSRIPVLLPRAYKSEPHISVKPPLHSPHHKNGGTTMSVDKHDNSARPRRGLARTDFSHGNGDNQGKGDIRDEQQRDTGSVPSGMQGEGDIKPDKSSTKDDSEFSTLCLSLLGNTNSSAGGDTSHANSLSMEEKTPKEVSVELDDDIMNEPFPVMEFCSTPRNSPTLEVVDNQDIPEDVKSPVSKLHKLLTQSCELVRELERSVMSSSSVADEEEAENLLDNENAP